MESNYIIVRGYSLTHLERGVNDLVRQGYVPHGPLILRMDDCLQPMFYWKPDHETHQTRHKA